MYAFSSIRNQEINNDLFFECLKNIGTIKSEEEFSGDQRQDLILFDCNQNYPKIIKEFYSEIDVFLRNFIPIIFLHPRREHKDELFSLLKWRNDGNAAALVVQPLKLGNGRLGFNFIEQLYPLCVEVASSGEDTATQSETVIRDEETSKKELKAKHLIPFFEELSKILSGDMGGAFELADESSRIPADAPTAHAHYIVHSPCNAVASPSSDPLSMGTPNPADILLSGVINIDVFYDNGSHTQPFQWVRAISAGEYSTEMVGFIDADGNDVPHSECRSDCWALGGLEVNLEPSANDANFGVFETSPQTKNNATTYTSSTSFTVNLSASSGGVTAGGSYTETNSKTYSIQDWDVLKKRGRWCYYQNTPFNGTKHVNTSCAGYAGGGLPNISTSTLNYLSQTVWQTNDVLTGPQSFSVGIDMYLYAIIRGSAMGIGAGAWQPNGNRISSNVPSTMTVDFTGAVP